jgi:hypothetical protein
MHDCMANSVAAFVIASVAFFGTVFVSSTSLMAVVLILEAGQKANADRIDHGWSPDVPAMLAGVRVVRLDRPQTLVNVQRAALRAGQADR